MSLSDDEDEFQSADEDTYDDHGILSQKDVKGIELNSIEEDKKQEDNVAKLIPEPLEEINKQDKKIIAEDDEEEEEALAERIRERNLKIARKFSAEIAKNIKSTAPIPVKTTPPVVDHSQDCEKDDEFLEDGDFTRSNQPPAPPPTPALSSSFSSSQDPTVSPIVTSDLKEEVDSVGSRYAWRAAARGSPKFKQPEVPQSKTQLYSDKQTQQAKSVSAQEALERLASNLSTDKKNLFEKVAEDLKKVSIKPDDLSSSSSGLGAGSIPIISDLGNSLSGWNWNSATKLLASASQVTSQVGSVLDSVVNVAQSTQQQQQQPSNPSSIQETETVRKQSSEKEKAREPVKKKDNQDETPRTKQQSVRPSMSATDVISNEAIIGYTLNTMESLGKKAFGVMTQRDESGSLQIKGLGRPWEHLMNVKKNPELSEHNVPEAQKVVTTKRDESATSKPSTCQAKKVEQNFDDDTNTITSSDYYSSSKKKTDDEQPNLRIRRRHRVAND